MHKIKETFLIQDDQSARSAVACINLIPRNSSYVVKVEPYKKRSPEQNAALWAVAYPPLMEHMGLSGEKDREYLHEYMCGEFWGWVEIEIMGKKKVRPRRTTTQDEHGERDVIPPELMYDFYGFIQRKGAEVGVFVPDPDPFYGLKVDKHW